MANAVRTELVESLVERCGGDLWGACSEYPKEDWQYEVSNGDTVLGYWEWVVSQAEADGVDVTSLAT